jgi:predicted anti-sigma-YlaC factor YlaD
MSDHINEWLQAYHDGELAEPQTKRVEGHLAQCADCRNELVTLQALSELLQEPHPAMDISPPERFVSQVGLRLPRQPERTNLQKMLHLGWLLTPVGLLGTWVMVHAALIVTGVVMFAIQFGFGGELLTGVLPFDQTAGYTGMIGWGTTISLVLTVIIGLLYSSWLASWWVSRRQANANGTQSIQIVN